MDKQNEKKLTKVSKNRKKIVSEQLQKNEENGSRVQEDELIVEIETFSQQQDEFLENKQQSLNSSSHNLNKQNKNQKQNMKRKAPTQNQYKINELHKKIKKQKSSSDKEEEVKDEKNNLNYNQDQDIYIDENYSQCNDAEELSVDYDENNDDKNDEFKYSVSNQNQQQKNNQIQQENHIKNNAINVSNAEQEELPKKKKKIQNYHCQFPLKGKIEQFCSRSYSSRAALYTHYISTHDKKKEIWDKYIRVDAQTFEGVLGRPKNIQNKDQQNNKNVIGNGKAPEDQKKLKEYLETQFEDPDTEAINHLLLFLSEFNKSPNTKTKSTDSFIQATNLMSIDPVACFPDGYFFEDDLPFIEFKQKLNFLKNDFKQQLKKIEQQPQEADQIFAHFLFEASLNIREDIYKEIAFLIQNFRTFLAEQKEIKDEKDMNCFNGQHIFEQCQDFEQFWRDQIMKNIEIQAIMFHNEFKLVNQSNYQENIVNIKFLLEFLKEFLQDYKYIKQNDENDGQ